MRAVAKKYRPTRGLYPKPTLQKFATANADALMKSKDTPSLTTGWLLCAVDLGLLPDGMEGCRATAPVALFNLPATRMVKTVLGGERFPAVPILARPSRNR